MSDSRELIPVGNLDYSLIPKLTGGFSVYVPSEIPTNIPIHIIINAREPGRFRINKIKRLKPDTPSLQVNTDNFQAEIVPGLQSLELPIDTFDRNPGRYELNFDSKETRSGRTERHDLTIKILPHSILRTGVAIFIGKSRYYIVAVMPAMALLICPDNYKTLGHIGFHEAIISACIIKNTLFTLSVSGLLHIYCLKTLERKTTRLSSSILTSDTIHSDKYGRLVWHHSNRITCFEYINGELLFIPRPQGGGRRCAKKIFKADAGGSSIRYRLGDRFFSVNQSGGRKEFEIHGAAPSMAFLDTDNANKLPVFWFKQGVSIVGYEWSGTEFKEVFSYTARPSYNLRCNGPDLYFSHWRMMGRDKVSPFLETSRQTIYFVKAIDNSELNHTCSAFNHKSGLYATGDKAGIIRILKDVETVICITAHNASPCINCETGKTAVDNFISALCWINETDLASVGLDSCIKCYRTSVSGTDIDADLLWERELPAGGQSMAMDADQLMVVTNDSLIGIDPEGGEILFQWDSPGPVLDPVAITGDGDVVVGDWQGNLHFFKAGLKTRSKKICKGAAIFAIQAVSDQWLFVVTEKHEGLLVDTSDECSLVGKCRYQLHFGERSAKDIMAFYPAVSIITHEWVNNIMSPTPVFLYPVKNMAAVNGVLHLTEYQNVWSSLPPLLEM